MKEHRSREEIESWFETDSQRTTERLLSLDTELLLDIRDNTKRTCELLEKLVEEEHCKSDTEGESPRVSLTPVVACPFCHTLPCQCAARGMGSGSYP